MKITTQVKPISKAQEKRERVDQAIKTLQRFIKPGDTVFTTLKSVSRSGMYRRIKLMIAGIDHEGRPDIIDISGMVATVLDNKWHDDDDDGSVGVSGCGMDMGFHLVHNLGYTLYKDGFDCIGEKCPSNDHLNGDRIYSPHHHQGGGYTIKQRWV